MKSLVGVEYLTDPQAVASITGFLLAASITDAVCWAVADIPTNLIRTGQYHIFADQSLRFWQLPLSWVRFFQLQLRQLATLTVIAECIRR